MSVSATPTSPAQATQAPIKERYWEGDEETWYCELYLPIFREALRKQGFKNLARQMPENNYRTAYRGLKRHIPHLSKVMYEQWTRLPPNFLRDHLPSNVPFAGRPVSYRSHVEFMEKLKARDLRSAACQRKGAKLMMMVFQMYALQVEPQWLDRYVDVTAKVEEADLTNYSPGCKLGRLIICESYW